MGIKHQCYILHPLTPSVFLHNYPTTQGIRNQGSREIRTHLRVKAISYPVYTIKQTSRNHRANIEQLEHTLCTCILNTVV